MSRAPRAELSGRAGFCPANRGIAVGRPMCSAFGPPICSFIIGVPICSVMGSAICGGMPSSQFMLMRFSFQ